MIAAIVVAALAVAVALGLAIALIRSRRDSPPGPASRRWSEQLADAERQLAATGGDLESVRNELTATQAELAAARDGLAVTQAELAATRDELQASRAELAAARLQATTARNQLQEASAAGGDAPTLDEHEHALGALWSLVRIRQEWTNRRQALLHADGGPSEGGWVGASLAAVLEDEVSRIREDTGTPGTLRSSLPEEPSPGQCMLLVTGLQAVLDALARHCQGYDLYVHEWEHRLSAIVVCDGFDGPDEVADDAAAVVSAIAPAGGVLALDRDSQGRLRARLSLAPPGVSA